MSKTGIRGKLDFAGVEARIRRGGETGIHAALQVLLDESQKQVPRDTGRLAGTGKVTSEGLHGQVSYGTEYGVFVHERTGVRHRHGQKAKFLEDPAHDSSVQTRMVSQLADEIRGMLG